MDKEPIAPKNEVLAVSETARRIKELKKDLEKIVSLTEYFPELKAHLQKMCVEDFAELEDPDAYSRVEEYQELIGSGTRGEVVGVNAELHRAVLHQIDVFLDEHGV